MGDGEGRGNIGATVERTEHVVAQHVVMMSDFASRPRRTASDKEDLSELSSLSIPNEDHGLHFVLHICLSKLHYLTRSRVQNTQLAKYSQKSR